MKHRKEEEKKRRMKSVGDHIWESLIGFVTGIIILVFCGMMLLVLRSWVVTWDETLDAVKDIQSELRRMKERHQV